ncbi:MAG: MotA/TolQ/ExbB proton channel family protein [Methanosarcinales archaeon]|nr:MotA/TolQ/ExbB proton channel family protein [Methanosarcinales archaeon]
MSLESIITHFPQILQSAIYIISTSLLYPVIIVLLGLTLWLITEIGVFTVEYLARTGRLSKKNPEDIEREIIKTKSMIDGGEFRSGIDLLNRSTTSRFVYLFLDGLLAIKEKEIELDNPGTYKKLFPVNLEKLLQRCDLLISKRLEKSKAMIRLGPMFGLMGTLIPMGPALLALTKGDVETLAGSLIIAFGTTVVGLLIGGVSYLITTVRTRWYRQDMNDVHYICEVLFGGEG